MTMARLLGPRQRRFTTAASTSSPGQNKTCMPAVAAGHSERGRQPFVSQDSRTHRMWATCLLLFLVCPQRPRVASHTLSGPGVSSPKPELFPPYDGDIYGLGTPSFSY